MVLEFFWKFTEVLCSSVFGFVGSFWKFLEVFGSLLEVFEVFGSFLKVSFFSSVSKFWAVCCISGRLSCGLNFVKATSPGLARNLASAAFSYFHCFCCLVLPIILLAKPKPEGELPCS